MRSARKIALSCIILLLYSTTKAQLKLPYFFSDNMVLQQQTNAAIWGWDHSGTTITVKTSWNKKTYRTTTDANGKWKLSVETPVYGGPYEISITGNKTIVLHNVLIGEVWLCSGQSNMEMPVKGYKNTPVYKSNEVILHAKNKNIRLFTLPRNPKATLQDTCKQSEWKEANPASVADFSATGYFFGRLLNEMLDMPVGLICSSYGGSPVEAFMSDETLKDFPTIKVPLHIDTLKVNNRTATALYNGMIHPLIGFTLKGCIWYQGESNYDRPDQYEQLFPAMVKEWRNEWGIGNFSFYYAQIAPFDYAELPPYNMGGKYNSAYLRDAQRKSLASIPASGMAVLMDIGEEKNIHPLHKQEGGERMALLALANTYHMEGFAAASPSFDSMKIEGNIIHLRFRDAPNGLTSYGQPLTQFEVAGSNKIFYPAHAVFTYKGIDIVAPEVKAPVAVRYAFKDFIKGEVFSTEGLPLSSFRTDNW